MAAAVLVVVGATLLVACGGAEQVPLAELAVQQERYDGRRVQTSGTVRGIQDGRNGTVHHVLEDRAKNRVAVPSETVRQQEGEVVTVEGLFVFDETRGRTLQDVELLAASGG